MQENRYKGEEVKHSREELALDKFPPHLCVLIYKMRKFDKTISKVSWLFCMILRRARNRLLSMYVSKFDKLKYTQPAMNNHGKETYIWGLQGSQLLNKCREQHSLVESWFFTCCLIWCWESHWIHLWKLPGPNQFPLSKRRDLVRKHHFLRYWKLKKRQSRYLGWGHPDISGSLSIVSHQTACPTWPQNWKLYPL